jgi:hypothetical protein
VAKPPPPAHAHVRARAREPARAHRPPAALRVVEARFDEARVWRHYSRLAGGFWSFSET